jgi:hypothetical protein
MNRTIFRYSTHSSIPFICLLFLCMNNPSDNDDDTDNGRVIKGRFTDINNRPVSGAFVRILPINFVPSLSLPKKALLASDTTDGNGNYQIPVADSGVFNLEGSKDDLGVFVDSIVVPNDTNDITIPDNILKKVGVIKGISYMPGQNDTNQVRVTLYIPGTGRITKPVIGGGFSFLGVPEGKYQLIIDPTLNAYNVKIIDTALIAGDTLNMDTVRLDLFEPDTIEILSTSIFGNLGPNKIYRLNQTSLIPAGQTLLIDSGTTIIFNGDFYITSTEKSKLIANGTAASPVVFKNPFAGTQSGNIAVDNHASFSYCIFDNHRVF